jgi:poly(A) polymerase
MAPLPPWPAEQWLLLALLASLPDPLAPAGRLQLPHRAQRQLHGLVQLRSWLADQVEFLPLRPSAITDGLERQGITPEAVLLAIVTLPPRPWRRPLLRWLLRWRSTPAPITAGELIRQGIQPGPELGARLRALRADRLDLERS